jgi:hypothetical protein
MQAYTKKPGGAQVGSPDVPLLFFLDTEMGNAVSLNCSGPEDGCHGDY